MSRAPYKYLDYYTFEDADLFFGREEETQRMVGEILSTRLLVLFSPSGSGKTSLINAGVRPQLESMGYRTIYTRLETEPITSVCHAVASALKIPCDGADQNLYTFLQTVTGQADKPLVIFLDQFEEFFTVFREQHDRRQAFVDQLARIKYDDQLPVFVVLSLREDYFVNLHEFRDAIPSIFQNNANLRLEPFTDAEARRAIVNPLQAQDIGGSIDPALVDALIRDLKDSQPGIEPIKLQIVCHTLWKRKQTDVGQITKLDYQACGGAATILSHHVQDLLNQIPRRQHGFMVRIFEALKTEDDTKRFRSLTELQQELKLKQPGRLAQMLDRLVALHLLRVEEKERAQWFEFKHDYLVGEINRWIKRRKDQLARQRFRYAIAPGIVLAVLLSIWAIFEYNRFEARFTEQDYAKQQKEVYLQRRFNPFGFRVTTGILYDQIKDYAAENAIQNGFIVSVGDQNSWSALAEKLSGIDAGLFLYRIGEKQAGIDTLIKTLTDKVWYVRHQAVRELVNLGQADAKVIAALVSALKDEDWNVRSYAADALVDLGQADAQVIAVVVAALNDPDADVRSQAARALGKVGQADAKAIASLVSALKDEDWNVRSYAADALGKVGQADVKVIAALVAALKDEDSDVRYRAAGTLVYLGQADAKVIAALVSALNDKDSGVRYRAAGALIYLGQADATVIAALVAALKDENSNVRYRAVAALGDLGQADAQVIGALVGVLKDPDAYVRYSAADALGKVGQADAKVIAALGAALKDESVIVRSQSAAALVNLGQADAQVIAVLVAALNDKDSDVRSQSAAALVNLGQADAQVIAVLVAALNDKDSDVRSQAAATLGNLGHSDVQVIETLVKTLKDEFSDVRFRAAGVLGNLLKFNSAKELFDYLADELSGFRTAGAQALAQQDSITDAIWAEINRLKDQDKRPWVRLGAWEAFELIQKRQKDEKAAKQLLRKADSLFQMDKFWQAEDQYQSAFDQLTEIICIDSVKIALAKFQQARCSAKMKKIVPTLDNLKIAFQYDKKNLWRASLIKELEQKDGDWALIQDNWYLKQVLLKPKSR